MELNSKKIFWVLLNASLAILAVGLIYTVRTIDRYSRSLNPAALINISAEGKVVTVPDIAKINFSVISEGVDPTVLQADNTKKINEAIAFVKKQGLDEKDIKTAQYNLSPRYEYDEKKRRSFIVDYELRQNVELKIRDFAKISEILAGLPDLGINEIGQLQFDIDDPDIYLNEARQEAFSKARTKAEAMAKQNGVKIKRVVTFSEFSGYVSPIFYSKGAGQLEAAPAPVIEPGSQEVTVQVSVTYEIK